MKRMLFDEDSEIIWRKKPVFILYLFGNPLNYLGVFIIICLSVLFKVQFGFETEDSSNNTMFLIYIGLLLILEPIIRILSFRNVEYIITEKAVYKSKGLFFKDYDSIYINYATELSVKSNFFERLFYSGTVVLKEDEDEFEHSIRKVNLSTVEVIKGFKFENVEDAEMVFEIIKNLKTVK